MVLELRVRWLGGARSAVPGQDISIGRDPACAVSLTSSAVSRQHGRLRFRESVWRYEDLGSSQGSFLDGVRVDAVDVVGRHQLVLGRGPDAVALDVEVVPDPAGGGPAPSSRAGDARTRLANGRPELGLAPPTVLVAPPPATSSVRVRAAGDVLVVLPGQRLSVGRDAANGLVLLHESVSRQHLVVEETQGRWVLRDVGSSAGTWLEDERVTSVPLHGVQTFRIGDAREGPTITVESDDRGAPPVQAHGRRPGRRSLMVGGLALGLAVVLAGGWFVYRALDRVSDTDLARGTVQLVAGDYGGSGTVVDKDKGLILTNAHVVAPDAPGFGAQYDTMEPDQTSVASVEVSVSSGPDRAAEPRFRGTVVAADGYLDLAVVRITETTSGAIVEPEDLTTLTALPLGDSDDLRPDDEIRVVGYPGAADSAAPTFTRGVVSGVTTDKRLSSNRAYVNTDARINHGNSGGLAADAGGHLVGVPTLGRPDQQGETALYAFRPVNFARPLIEAAQSGRPYTSPWTQPAPQGAKADLAGPVTSSNRTVASGCAAGEPVPGSATFGLDYQGFPGGGHTDLLAQLIAPATETSKAKLVAEVGTTHAYPTPLPADGCLTITFDPRATGQIPPGDYVLRVGLGGNLHVVGAWNVSVT